jgi:hypothetical protein
MDYARHLVKKTSGPAATVYSCPFCKHSTINRKGTRNQGRGHGLRTGGALHSQLSAHIRHEHPDELAHAGRIMAHSRSFEFRSETERSDAMTCARCLAQDLTRTTGRTWTFHYMRGVGSDADCYFVREARR